jgi:hypothetical protein
LGRDGAYNRTIYTATGKRRAIVRHPLSRLAEPFGNPAGYMN